MAAPNYDSNIQPLSFPGASPGRIRPRSRSSTFSDWNFKRNKPRHTPSLSLQNANQLRPKRFAEWDTPSSSDLSTPSSRTISQNPPSSPIVRPQTPQNLQQDVYPQARARLRNDPPLGMPRGPRPRSQSVTTFIAPTRNNSQDEVTRPAPVFIPERPVTPFPWDANSGESPGGEVSPTVPRQGPWKRIPSFKMASLSSKLKVSKLPFRRQAVEPKPPKSPIPRTSSDASRPNRPRPTLSILYDPTTGRISGVENVFPGVDPVSLLPPEKAENIRIGVSDRWNPDKIKELCIRFLKDLPIKIPDTFNLVVSTVLPNRTSERPEISRPLTAEPLTATSDDSHTLLPSPEERSSVDKPTQDTRGRSIIFSQYISLSPSDEDVLPQSTATSPIEETKVDAIPPLFSPSDQWAQEVLSAFSGPSSLVLSSDADADRPNNPKLHPVGYF